MDLSDFKIVKKSESYSVRYKKQTLMTIKRDTLIEVLREKLPLNIKKEIIVGTNFKIQSDEDIKAAQLEKAYTRLRRKALRNKNIRSITPKDDEFKHFRRAVNIIKEHKCTYAQFLQAQILGLTFANTFPRPSNLSTVSAEDRLVEYLHNLNKVEDIEKVERIKLTIYDKDTELMDNPTFVNYNKKISDKTATLQEAYFVYDCMVARKGEATSRVLDYIAKKEGRA